MPTLSGSSLYIGGQAATAAYIGSTLVWQAASGGDPAPDPDPDPGSSSPSSITVVAFSIAEAATGTTVTVSKPAGTAAGHVMVAALAQKGSATQPSDVTGWTKQLFASSTSVGVQVYTRVATGSEPSTYTFTAGVTDNVTVEIVTLSGVDATTPVDVTPAKDTAANGTSFVFNTPITTVTDNAVVLYSVVTQSNGTALVPDAALTLVTDSTGIGRRLNTAVFATTAAGTVPEVTYTTSSSLSKAGVALALRPASSGGGGGGGGGGTGGGGSTGTSTAPVGNLPGWTQLYAENFTTPATSSQVETVYPHLSVYPDGSGDGKYQAENVTVANGMLQVALHYVSGQGQGGALVIKPTTGDAWGQTYGRYSARVRADNLPGFGAALQLWPSDDVWEHGETDFPEGEFSDQIHGYNHQVGSNPGVNSLVINTGQTWQDWHVVTVEWAPNEMRFYLDGTLVGADGDAVASTERNWIFQAAEHGSGSATNVSGYLQVDWVALWKYTG